jgi:hypothetical protein
MRIFHKNRSAGSIQNISVGRSPLHSPIASPLQSPAFPPPHPGPGAAHLDESADPSDSQRLYPSGEQQVHPAHSALRPQSQDSPNHGYQGRPTVNVIPDQFDENSPPALTASAAANQEERRQKKHIRRGLFGLHSSKEHTSHSHTPTLALGHSHSTKKKGTGVESQEGLISQQTPAQYSGEGYSSDTYEEKENSNEYIPSHTDLDEQYYRQQDNFDSPESQTSSHYSSHPQDEESLSKPQQTYHRSYQPRQANTSNSYLPYNPPLDRPSLDIYDSYRSIRPPSQQSLGPPSPIASAQLSVELRPPINQVRQANHSSQSLNLQPGAGMARGEGSNPSMRQQLAQQHQQGEQQGHGQYGVPQAPRQLQQHSSSMTDHGRNTPPPTKSREDFNTQDYTALLQKHEELRMIIFLFPSSIAADMYSYL